ncbi:hypothetical protein C8R32_11612 [Nitrosospira sp. Nsp5]|uniref:LysM domain-containing protein n=1 Tax=Nitrosospira multiformis TaxID=1231 RepID=A0ABY0TCK9_9PROT|nr:MULTISPECIES: LysM domain-containing protein [Nitrosospira]PTR05766.1 hypothetical protein C8R32_11612 [Nitrosospira sp. Nsp5]SDQ62437.1 hypothetical protein SAMN05216402_1595 [Nitrosospira multiformis]
MDEALRKLEAILGGSAAGTQNFPPSSRYHGVATEVHASEDGRPKVYLKRRIVPAPERFSTISEHSVQEGERLDLIAGRYLGDAELYWRICDANGALRPNELIEAVGTRLRITLPEGAPGNGDA